MIHLDIREFMKQEPAIVQEARTSEICIGCLANKGKGDVLCWNCYKYRTDITPYKDFHGSLEEWLDYKESGVAV